MFSCLLASASPLLVPPDPPRQNPPRGFFSLSDILKVIVPGQVKMFRESLMEGKPEALLVALLMLVILFAFVFWFLKRRYVNGYGDKRVHEPIVE